MIKCLIETSPSHVDVQFARSLASCPLSHLFCPVWGQSGNVAAFVLMTLVVRVSTGLLLDVTVRKRRFRRL